MAASQPDQTVVNTGLMTEAPPPAMQIPQPEVPSP